MEKFSWLGTELFQSKGFQHLTHDEDVAAERVRYLNPLITILKIFKTDLTTLRILNDPFHRCGKKVYFYQLLHACLTTN